MVSRHYAKCSDGRYTAAATERVLKTENRQIYGSEKIPPEGEQAN
jgi:hypothetical protein